MSESPEIPTRSHEGAAALDIFYIDFNQVNFYFEDKDQENLYEIIVGKIFPEITTCRVFPLNGKQSVLDHAQDPTNKELIKNSIYILDRDFDELLGKIRNFDNIFYLEKYCIENYLLDEEAIINLAIETYPKEKRAAVKEKINAIEFQKTAIESLLPLFKLFFCVQKLELGIKNCSYPPEKFSSERKPWLIDPAKINIYLEKVKSQAIIKMVTPDLTDPFSDARVALPPEFKCENIVSGKFLAALVFHHVKSIYKLGSITADSFIFRLAKNSSLTELIPIAERIKAHLRTLGAI